MNTPIQNFLNKLVTKYDCIDEIWWFGSRANKKGVTAASDWDFLVFGNKSAYDLIKKDIDLSKKAKELVIGLLIKIEGDEFKSPWKHKERFEKLTLTDLKWKVISETVAEYCGYSKEEIEEDTYNCTPDWMKPRNKEEESWIKSFKVGFPTSVKLKAFRIWSAARKNQIILD
jgi:predicted nucleotidyltransferase